VTATIGAAGLAGVDLFGWGTIDLINTPSTLVLTTYLGATAADVRLLRGYDCLLPVIAFALILCVTPSAGRYLLVSTLVVVLAVCYVDSERVSAPNSSPCGADRQYRSESRGRTR
jgi:hypothetical protein